MEDFYSSSTFLKLLFTLFKWFHYFLSNFKSVGTVWSELYVLIDVSVLFWKDYPNPLSFFFFYFIGILLSLPKVKPLYLHKINNFQLQHITFNFFSRFKNVQLLSFKQPMSYPLFFEQICDRKTLNASLP